GDCRRRAKDRRAREQSGELRLAGAPLGNRRSSLEDCLDRLVGGFVGRLRDHGRWAIEAGQRLSQRISPKRTVAIGQVRLLVAVRKTDVRKVNVEWHAALQDAIGRVERSAKGADARKA